MLINKTIFTDHSENDIRISRVNQMDGKIGFKSFSAKYVLNGTEIYQVGNKRFEVVSGEYIVGNSITDSTIIIDNEKPVDGICIDISESKISNVIDSNFEDGIKLKEFILQSEWMVNKYKAKQTNLGYALKQIEAEFENLLNNKTQLNQEITFSIAECIVNDQKKIFQQFSNINSKKLETNGRLFTFLMDAKNFIDQNFLDKIDIESIANHVNISEYHFIRLFKKVFNITPYQYIIKKRLEFSKELLNNGLSIQETSYQVGFTDASSFSKSFKKEFNYAPSSIKKSNFLPI